MELTVVKKVKAEGARIHISFDPESPTIVMTLEYTCPKCAGWGCNKHSQNNDECKGGQVQQKLNPESLDQIFNDSQLLQIKATIQNLYLTVIGD